MALSFRPRRPAEARRPPTRYASSAAWLCLVYAALVVYASLYPFTGWRVRGGAVFEFVTRPLPSYWTAFDLVTNWVGYMPLGLLAFIALIRRAWWASVACAVATLAGTLLSFGLETLQNFLPHRVPSNLDWASNASGALLGAAIGALLLNRLGGIARWQTVRERWFTQPSAGGIALLWLWPVGLLFPLSAPFAVGQVLEQVRAGTEAWLSDTPLAGWAATWLAAPAVPRGASTALEEFVLITLGLLAPCFLAFTVSRPGWRRLVLQTLTVCGGVLVTCLSTALSFGPEHTFAWVTPVAWWAVATACAVAWCCAWASRRAAAAMGLMTLAVLVVLVTQAPGDPYFALNLQAWERGRFIRFHGASQWVGWFWPYLAVAYLMGVLTRRHPRPPPQSPTEPPSPWPRVDDDTP